MNRIAPVPAPAADDAGRIWEVHRAWPDFTAGDYVLEVLGPGRPGVQGARLRDGRFELLRGDDPGLPALRAEPRHGEVVSHRPGIRAVVRGQGCYIKAFRPGEGEDRQAVGVPDSAAHGAALPSLAGDVAQDRFAAAHTQVMAAAGTLRVSPARLLAYTDAAWLRLKELAT